MSHAKELEIRRQFLDEAQEYLDTLDATVLGLSSSRIEIQKVNAALRSAHSIKGGAGMMGFQLLSQLAHRLEDGFKVLKTQHQSLEVDAVLENLLLAAVSSLRVVIECDRRSQVLDERTLQEIDQVFEQLHDRLGDPQPEDAASILASDSGQDIVAMLFETEVEGCLQRLETVLADPTQPCLQEEVTILAQELSGLGEMLQLDAFCHLCSSVTRAIERMPDQISAIAQSALQAWRQTQALVITGQLEHLPRTIALNDATVIQAETAWADLGADLEVTRPERGLEAAVQGWQGLTGAELELLNLDNWDDLQTDWQESAAELGNASPPNSESFPDLQELPQPWLSEDATWDEAAEYEAAHYESAHYETAQWQDVVQPGRQEPDIVAAEAEIWTDPEPVSPPEPIAPPIRESHVTDFRVLDVKPGEPSQADPNLDEAATVRVSVRQLNQLNDLFGELTIERNGLNLYLKRLRSLTQSLSHRVRLLDHSNYQMRIAYDRIASRATLRLPMSLAAESVHAVNGNSQSEPAANGQLKGHPQPLANLLQPTFDSLELDRYHDLNWLSQQVMETIVQIQEVTTDVQLSLDETDQTARELNKTAKQLQTTLTQIRMRPLSEVVDRFPRALREWCLQYGKSASLTITGGDTLLDRTILDALSDPLMHLFRNAFDHGIESPQVRRAAGKLETGTITIEALHRGSRTLIRIQDDGNGIPLDKVRSRAVEMGLDPHLLETATDEDLLSLIFEPGFSTSATVTELSGRGVGMDVVRESLRQIRGDITVDTRSGMGTTFTLSVPLTLSVVTALLVESQGMLLAVPSDAIEEMIELHPSAIIRSLGSEVLNWQGQLLQFIRLSHWFQFNCPHPPHGLETPPNLDCEAVLLVSHGDRRLAIQVDRAWGEQEVAIRRAEGTLPLPVGFTGCAIVADGRVVPLVNLAELLDWICGDEATATSPGATRSFRLFPEMAHRLPAGTRDARPRALAEGQDPKPTILIVDDSINVRRFLALTLEGAGYRVEQAQDGQDALEKLQRGLVVQAIICDIEMPRLDGYGFLGQLKADSSLQHLPVAMLTSRSGEKHRQLALNLGAAAYFSKPHNEQLLLQTLTDWMQRHEADA